jgi:hypothetical protein
VRRQWRVFFELEPGGHLAFEPGGSLHTGFLLPIGVLPVVLSLLVPVVVSVVVPALPPPLVVTLPVLAGAALHVPLPARPYWHLACWAAAVDDKTNSAAKTSAIRGDFLRMATP